MAHAQLTTGAIAGTITDNSDAGVPGVTLTATNLDTGRARNAVTTEHGAFRLDGMTPGRYLVKAELAGFMTEERELVVAGTAVVTVDIKLRMSSLVEKVEVVAADSLIDVTQNQVKTQMNDAMIQTVPVNGRRFQDLALLAPGVSIDYGSTRSGTTDAIAFFGFNERYKSIYVDGVDLNDELTGGGTGISDAPRAQVSMEAIQEVEVVRNQFSAEVGRQQAGVVNIITKSGTNDYRGRGFGFFRHDAFDKKNAFATGTLPFHQTQAGANLGGPIARNKTHFFGSYELWDSELVSTIRIPDALLAWLPDPRTELPITNNRNNLFGKLTHSFTSAHVLNVTYLYDRQKADGQAAASDSAADARFLEKQNDNFMVTRLTSSLGGGMANELRVGFSRSFTDRPVENGTAESVFPGLRTGTPNNMPQGRTQKNLVISDVLFKHLSLAGTHSLKVGGEANIVRYPTNLNLFQFGQYTFARAEPPGLTNPPIQYTLGRYAFDFADLNSNFYGAFIQDDWQIGSRLTVNLGLRYDVETYGGAYAGEDYPAFANTDEAIRFLLTTSVGGANAGTLYKMRETDKDNIQPRVGFNWSLSEDGRTSVRGGYGRFVEGGHDPISTSGTLRPNRAQTYVGSGALFSLLSFYPNEPPESILNQFSRISLVSAFPGVFVTSAYANQFTIGLERQLPWETALAVDYAAIRSRDNPRTVNVNHPVDGVCPYLASCAAVNVNVSNGRIESDALQLQLRRRFGGAFGLLLAYTLLDAKEDGPSTSPYSERSRLRPDAQRRATPVHRERTAPSPIRVPCFCGRHIGLGVPVQRDRRRGHHR